VMAGYGACASDWEHLCALGLQGDLLPVVSDLTAKTSSNSSLKSLGKVPSRFNRAGRVVGIWGWTKHISKAIEIDRWKRDDRLGICLQTRLVRALDIDVDDEAQAKEIQGAFELELGTLPARTRHNSGKRLLAVKVAGELKKTAFDVDGGRVEILGNGQHFVAVGTHPSGVRYEWAEGLPDNIPEVSEAALNEAIEQVKKRFGTGAPNGSKPGGSKPGGAKPGGRCNTSAEGLDFDSLIALSQVTELTLDQLEAALGFLGPEIADDYESWIKVGHALKSLTPTEFADRARELWHSFSSASPRYDPGQCDEKWAGFSPRRTDFRAIFAEARRRDWKRPDTPDFEDDLSDLGNVTVLWWLHPGSLRFVVEAGEWMHWDGEKWQRDTSGSLVQDAVQGVSKFLRDRAEAKAKRLLDPALDDSTRTIVKRVITSLNVWAKKCRSRKVIRDCIALAQADRRFTTSVQELDRDPWLLGVENGVIDLRTGALRADAMSDLVTRRCALRYDPSVRNERWIQFIDEMSGQLADSNPPQITPRAQLSAYLHRMLGYCLTGLTQEQKMFLAIGNGSNGKNVLFDTMAAVLGPYAKAVSPEVLMASRYAQDPERASPVLASLAGCRLAVCSESRVGQSLDVSMVKRHTGGGVMTARFMRQDSFGFEITHKLVLMSNNQPDLDQVDDAIRGRLHLIPFDVRWNRPGEVRKDERLPDGDKELGTKLKQNLEGVLTWLVQGAVLYGRDGLAPPPQVTDVTGEYFEEQDAVERFLAECDLCEPNQGVSATDALQGFRGWASEADAAAVMSPKAFSQALRRHGVRWEKRKAGTFYGLVLPDLDDFKV
jgi:putative DNA primase/helicase